MADPVEVAIEVALLKRVTDWAAVQSPAIAISVPNIEFNPPAASKTTKWLKASFLPAPSVGLAIGFNSTNQHYGILQIDACYGIGAGPAVIGRLAAQIIALFDRGTKMTQDDFRVSIWKKPFRGPLLRDEVWSIIPVSIPYVAFAPNPA